MVFWASRRMRSGGGWLGRQPVGGVVGGKGRAGSAPPPGRCGFLLALLLILPVLVTLITTVVCPTDGEPYRLVRISAWMAIGSHGVAIVALLLLHRSTLGVLAAAIGYAALGVSSALTVPCVSVVRRRLPDDNRASVFSLLEALPIGGQAAGALLSGWTVTRLGAGHGLAVLLLPAVVVSAVGLSRLRTPAPDQAGIARFGGARLRHCHRSAFRDELTLERTLSPSPTWWDRRVLGWAGRAGVRPDQAIPDRDQASDLGRASGQGRAPDRPGSGPARPAQARAR